MSAPAGIGVEAVLKEAYTILQEVGNKSDVACEYEMFDFEADEYDEDYKKVFCDYDGNAYNIYGKQLEKIFNSTNFNDIGSRRYLFKYIENSGAYEMLKEMGMEEGDTIKLFDMEFEFFDEEYNDYE